jgi:hypothetical protein
MAAVTTTTDAHFAGFGQSPGKSGDFAFLKHFSRL